MKPIKNSKAASTISEEQQDNDNTQPNDVLKKTSNQENDEKKLKEDSSKFQNAKPEAISRLKSYFSSQKKPRPYLINKTNLISQTQDLRKKNFSKIIPLFLIGDYKSLSIPKIDFIEGVIPEDKKPIFLANPMKYSYSPELQIIFPAEEPIGDEAFDLQNGAVMWFCEANDMSSLQYLKNKYEKFNKLKTILMKLPNIGLIAYEKEEVIIEEALEERFSKECEDFSKVLKTNYVKFPLKNAKNIYLTIWEQLEKFFDEKLKKILDKMQKKLENTKFERSLLVDMAKYISQNKDCFSQETLEKRVFLLLGRPNDIVYSQFKSLLQPYLEKYEVIFKKNYEENIKNSHKSKSLKYLQIRKNPLIDDNDSKFKFIFTESEIKDLTKLYCEYSHFNSLKNTNNKSGIILKDSKNLMHINIDSIFRAIFGFISAENYKEMKDFLENNAKM